MITANDAAPEPPRWFDKCEHDRLIDDYGPAGPYWEFFRLWLRWWRATHEDDELSDYLLIDEHARWCKENAT